MDEPSFEQVWNAAEPPPPPPIWKTAPLTIVLSTIAIGMSLLYWAGKDMAFAFEDEPHIWAGQYWRLVLSCFLHANTWHLVFNLFAGWDLGRPLERRYGSARMLALFVVLAIGSGAAQFLSGDPAIGMSGVIYGYFGLILGAGRAPHGPRLQLHPKTTAVVLGWLVLCIVMTRSGAWNIGNVAHVAGLLIGLGLGWALRANNPLTRLAAVAGIAVALAPATRFMRWDPDWWVYRGERYERRGESGRAEACLRKAVEKTTDREQIERLLLYLGYRAFERKAYGDAISYYDRALQVTSKKNRIRAYLASACIGKGDLARARELLLQLDPDDLDESLRTDPRFRQNMRWAKCAATGTAPEVMTTLPEEDEDEGPE
jgi:membrane associated rhomboid family serine protease